MNILVVGASGATGRLLVAELLQQGHSVIIIIRSSQNFTDKVLNHKNISIIKANLLDLSDAEMTQYIKDCNVVACCLGHNMTFKGIYGSPRRLVADATRRLCNAAKNNHSLVKFVLMNTTGNRNHDLCELISFAEHCVMFLIRHLLPPHSDNEQAAEYLRTKIGQNNKSIEWVVVRPDSLIDNNEVSEYEAHPSPIRSAIFDAGKTSRINVAHLMAELIEVESTWNKWKGRMPVIYNKEQ